MNSSLKTYLVFAVLVIAVAVVAFKMGAGQDKAVMPTDSGSMQTGVKSTAPVHKEKALTADHPAFKFTHFRVGNRNVKSIFADGDEVWVGTSGGVIRYNMRTDQHRMYDVKSGLLSNGVFHVSKMDGKIVVGTYGGGMSLYDRNKETWETFNIPDGLGDAFVYDVLKMSNGDVWIATWSGANRVRKGELKNRKQWDLYTVENTQGGLPNDWVYGLAEGKNGEVWMATEGGLARFKDGKWSNWAHADGLGADFEKVKADIKFDNDPAKVSSHHARQKVEQGLENINIAYNPNYIVALLVDHNGNVWCGTWGGGLSEYNGKTWKTYTVKDGLPADHIFMLHEDNSGRIWIGTSNGLSLFDGKQFRNYSVADGLFSKNVFSMDIDKNGEFWVGSFGGVTRIQGL